MKLPSLSYLNEKTVKTFSRFPIVLINTIIGTFFAIYLVESSKSSHENYYFFNLVLTCALGLTLFLSVALFSERINLDKSKKSFLNIFALILLILYYFSLPENSDISSEKSEFITRFFLFNLSLHLMIAFIPFIGKNTPNGFWHYNRILFERIIIALVYSGIIYGGLSIALYSIDNLLEIKVRYQIYSELWVFIVGIFNTWFFLSGIPEDFHQLESKSDFPKDLKMLVQYILIPIVIIYLIILYLYAGKIILNWDWPHGKVSSLIIGCSFTGILSLLLIYPLQNTSEKVWIRAFSKTFYIILLPLIIMLYFAVSRRIQDYGITENRYFLLITSFWLFGISLYFIFSKNKNIKLIPVSLCIVSFLTSFGPWGAFDVSVKSQLKRLETLLIKDNIMKNGIIEKISSKIPVVDNQEISSILNYLNKRDKLKIVVRWFRVPVNLGKSYENPRKVIEAMGLTYMQPYYGGERNKNNEYFNFSVLNKNDYYDISGYDGLIKVSLYKDSQPCNFLFNKQSFSLVYNQENLVITLFKEKEKLMDLPLDNLIKKLTDKYIGVSSQIPQEEMVLERENNKVKLNLPPP